MNPQQTRDKSPLQDGRRFIPGIEQLDPTRLTSAPTLLTGNRPAFLNTEPGCCKYSHDHNRRCP
ncbi:rCG55381 [Rattus norvegicus]|uniref:RCG55381 n=1 Tax=Rattus norvegicus TaxID=10116 RepID=A6JR49_RAT|nr:rCG55381 [Rattus norvegicus]